MQSACQEFWAAVVKIVASHGGGRGDGDRIRIFQETSRGLGDSIDVKNEREKRVRNNFYGFGLRLDHSGYAEEETLEERPIC